MRLGFILLGLTCTLCLIGCKQLPLRDHFPNMAGRKTKPVVDEKLESQLSLARLSERHGQHEYATQVYKAILRKHPENVAAYHRLAVIAARESEFAEAETHFQKALELGDRSAHLLADVGYYFYLRDQLDEAEKLLRESLEADHNQKGARTNLALVLGEQGRFDDAYAEFNKVLSDGESHANMGYIYSLNGDLDQAEREFHIALSLDNTLRPAAEALLELNNRHKVAASIARASKNADEKATGRANVSAPPAHDESPGVQQASAQAPASAAQTDPRAQEGKLIASMFDRPATLVDERTGLPARPARRQVARPATVAAPRNRSAATAANAAAAIMDAPLPETPFFDAADRNLAPPNPANPNPGTDAALSHSEHLTTGPLENNRSYGRQTEAASGSNTRPAALPWQQSTWSAQR